MPKLHVLKAEEHIKATTQRVPGARFDIPPLDISPSQIHKPPVAKEKESERTTSEEIEEMINRMERL